jgi:hypothetical protein
LQLVRREEDILVVALQVAAHQGESSPEVIEHTVGSREAVTKATGSWVEDLEPSYLVAMRGAFTARRAARPSRGADRDEAMVSFAVELLVIEIASGRITDSGGGMEYQDLAAVGHRLPGRGTARAAAGRPAGAGLTSA